MAISGRFTLLPLMLSRVYCNANKQLFQVKELALPFQPALRNYVSSSDDNMRSIEVGVTHDGETIVYYHPAPDVTYEMTKPIPISDPTLDSPECHDLILKSRLHTDILMDKKAPAIEELAKMFYTTKHRWYPVGQYHTRRRNRNPPKDR